MTISSAVAGDLIEEMYGDWSYYDPAWWADMTETIQEYRNVRQFLKAHPDWSIPKWWPGQPNYGSRQYQLDNWFQARA